MNKAIYSSDPQDVWKQFEAAKSYKNGIDLYTTVEKNERFLRGDQWNGVNAPDLDKPVINIIKRIESYKTAIIVSDDISYQVESEDDSKKITVDALTQMIDAVLEDNDITSLNRELISDAGYMGDCCLVGWFDPDAETGQAAKGKVVLEQVDNTNVGFGNPFSNEVQTQPYILIVRRCFVDSARDEAEANGEDPAEIDANDDENQGETGSDNQLVTVITKLWKQDGRVHFCKTTRDAVVKGDTATEMTLYPVAWMNWEKRRSSMHGESDVKEIIPNQIAINKLFALYLRSVQMNAFPTLVYDASRISKWSNKVGAAIEARGSVGNDIATYIRGADASYQVADVIDRMISLTKDAKGASDAALGNITPQNTSAIVAVQQACAYPLQLQKNAFKAFVEQYVRFIGDMLAAYGGVREIFTDATDDEMQYIGGEARLPRTIDCSTFRDLLRCMKVSVGDSAYWSQLTQQNTLDNLVQSGILTDAALYLKSMPGDTVPNKQEIIKSIEEQQAAQQMPAGYQSAPTTVPTGQPFLQ